MSTIGTGFSLSPALIRTLIAALLAGPVGTLVYVLGFTSWAVVTGGAQLNDLFVSPLHMARQTFEWAQLGAMVGWPAMLVGGLPAHAVFYALRLRAVWPYTLAGAAVGGIVSVAWIKLAFGSGMSGDMTGFAITGAIVGAISATIFWLIRRPDRDAQRATIAA